MTTKSAAIAAKSQSRLTTILQNSALKFQRSELKREHSQPKPSTRYKASDAAPHPQQNNPKPPTKESSLKNKSEEPQSVATQKLRSQTFRGFFISLIVALAAFSFLNGPAILANIMYYANRWNLLGSSQGATGFVANASAPVASAPTLIVPKISIRVPVVLDQSGNDATIKTELQHGVVHFAGTALPGQNGTIAIFGHSSNNIFARGNYKFIFTMLDKLRPGDRVEVDFQNTRYIYEMTGSEVVPPSDAAVLDNTGVPTLELITCTPVGTNLNRLVVQAKQISPNPNTNTPAIAIQTNAAQHLPGN